MIRNVLVPTSLSLLLVFWANSHCNADLVAYWNLNAYNTTTATYDADQGADTSAELDVSNIMAAPNALLNPNGVTGSDINLSPPDTAPDDVLKGLVIITGGNSTTAANNGRFLDITVNLSGFFNPIVSFAAQKGNLDGFDENTLTYSVNGGGFSAAFSGIDPEDTAGGTGVYGLVTRDFSSFNDLDGASEVVFRYTFLGAERDGSGNRVDNIQVNATAVPEASAFLFGGLICGVVGLLKCGRRSRVEQVGCED